MRNIKRGSLRPQLYRGPASIAYERVETFSYAYDIGLYTTVLHPGINDKFHYDQLKASSLSSL